jgi:hypothetical protein
VVIVYPTSVLAPHDPTVGSGPGVMARALRTGRVLVTDGGFPYTDARDLADLFGVLFAAADPPPRIMATAEFLTHARYFELLVELTGRADLRGAAHPGRRAARSRPRRRSRPALARAFDSAHERGGARLTRSVPVDDREARALLGRDPIPIADSLRDTIAWMAEAGVIEPRHAGRLAGQEFADRL